MDYTRRSAQAQLHRPTLPIMTENLQETIVTAPDTTEAHTRPRRTLSLAVRRDGGAPLRRPSSLSSKQTNVESRGDGCSSNVDTVPLRHLTAGRKALKIAHAGETYLLQITKANKLILTKPAVGEKAASVKV